MGEEKIIIGLAHFMTLVKSYPLQPGKSIDGFADALEHTLKSYRFLMVNTRKLYDGGFSISCRRDNLAINHVGFDIDCSIDIKPQGDSVVIEYTDRISGFNNVTRGIKALFDFLPVGTSKLWGIHERHEIPYKLHDSILNYLHTSN